MGCRSISTSRRLAFLIACLLAPRLAFGQGTEDVNAGQFDFSLPGARSLAMAGSFVALADDATSAYSNPAGLIQLGRPELSLEYRGWSFDATAITRGHAFGVPSARGLDTIPGPVEEKFPSTTSGVSFLSAVYPRTRWAVGLFLHQFPRFETRKDIQGVFFDCAGGFLDEPAGSGAVPFCSRVVEQTGGIDRDQPKDQRIEIGLANVGLTFAYNLTETLAVGVSGLLYDFSMNSENRVFDVSQDPFGPKDRNRLMLIGSQIGDDRAFALTGGLRWHPAEEWILGGAFRVGPSFTYWHELRTGPAHPYRDPCPNDLCSRQEVRYKVPDTFAAGVVYRPAPVWTVGVQYDFVDFTDLLAERRQTSGLGGQAQQVLENGLKIDDGHRFRLGTEYVKVLRGGNVVSLRAGAWYDTAHRAYFVADSSAGLPFPQYALLFPRGERQAHVTAGLGLAIQPRFQIDAGFDISSLYQTFSVSTIWKF